MHIDLMSAQVGKMASSILRGQVIRYKISTGPPFPLEEAWNQSSSSAVSGSGGLLSFQTGLSELPRRGRRLDGER